ncbi:M64 family metallopeptidase [Synoicihabitans lomoniglobus]|uniref:M64 family metallopeptidase n=1 Tax=Synoicihabitans lomoniglobus TaxID=2909285 RepID=A0AAF0CSX6_9BACT|nr:M64 family metallo-endopeptidase [Opitutaceae bacterium LMO-M01]WED67450.1 M64 family metallopeptidase [Opitutaceae bacterium LMO-M01]
MITPSRRFVLRFPSLLGIIALLSGLTASAQSPVLRTLRDSGPTSNHINIVLLGDGFTAAQEQDFFTAAENMLEVIVNDPAMSAFASLTNGFAVFTASNESGTGIPAENLTPDTYYKSTFVEGENARLAYVSDPVGYNRIYTILSTYTPEYDYVVVIINSTRYGGAGGAVMYTTLNAASDEIVLHESGHSFAGLTDEYIDEAIASDYPAGEFANSTEFTDRTKISWRKFITDTTAIPTTEVPSGEELVGAWEGSNYRTSGSFRPTYNSKMRSLGRPWGPVNLRAFADAVNRLNINNATTAPVISDQPDPTQVVSGQSLTLTATVSGPGPFTYQWALNGQFLVGETNPTLSRAYVTTADLGDYTVEVSNAVGRSISAAATVSFDPVDPGTGEPDDGGEVVASHGRLTNLSVRTQAGTGSQTLTVGFAIGEATADQTEKSLLVRVIGPALATFGVAGTLADPTVSLAPLGQSAMATNDNWNGDANLKAAFVTVGAFPLDDDSSADSALLHATTNGAYTAQVGSGDNGTGIALVEVYDTGSTDTPRLVNLSARSQVGIGSDALIAGFVYDGNVPARLLIRAVGPTLGGFGVDGVLVDPVLTVRVLGETTVLASNDDWAGADALKTAFAAVGAFPFPHESSLDSALIVEIQPGAYTATISGYSDTTGVALVEVYELP